MIQLTESEHERLMQDHAALRDALATLAGAVDGLHASDEIVAAFQRADPELADAVMKAHGRALEVLRETGIRARTPAGVWG